MDRKALEQQLLSIGFTQEQIDALSVMDDQAFATFVNTTLAAKAGAGSGDAAASGNATANADRQTMEAELIAAGVVSPEELANMTDDEVLQMYQQWQSGAYAEDTGVKPPKPGASKPAGNGTGNNTGEGSGNPAGGTNGGADMVQITRQEFAELQRGVRLAQGQLRQFSEDSRRRQRAERLQTVRALVATWRDQRKITPADADENAKGFNLFNKLLAADGTAVRKYGEKSATEFDAEVGRINALPRDYIRMFAEKIVPGEAGAGGADDDPSIAGDVAAAIEHAKKRNAIAARGRGKVA